MPLSEWTDGYYGDRRQTLPELFAGLEAVATAQEREAIRNEQPAWARMWMGLVFARTRVVCGRLFTNRLIVKPFVGVAAAPYLEAGRQRRRDAGGGTGADAVRAGLRLLRLAGDAAAGHTGRLAGATGLVVAPAGRDRARRFQSLWFAAPTTPPGALTMHHILATLIAALTFNQAVRSPRNHRP